MRAAAPVGVATTLDAPRSFFGGQSSRTSSMRRSQALTLCCIFFCAGSALVLFPALELTRCSAARRSANRCDLARGACLLDTLEAKDTPPADKSAGHAGLGSEESTDVHAR